MKTVPFKLLRERFFIQEYIGIAEIPVEPILDLSDTPDNSLCVGVAAKYDEGSISPASYRCRMRARDAIGQLCQQPVWNISK